MKCLALGVIVAWSIAPRASADVNTLADAMIAAHGGYERWSAAPSCTFVDSWENGRGFRTTVEQGTRRAYLETDGGSTRVAWDGATCTSVGWPEEGAPPRFIALLNWYFVNLPWVVKDPGVHLEEGTGTLLDDPKQYRTLKLTYADGVGDTPDDWYDLYVDPDTHRLVACKYIVTYRALLPEGVESTSPHVLFYDEWTTVDGLLVPTHFTIREENGDPYSSCTISDWSFREPFDAARLDLGPNAVVDESTP
jgi:hypothetical protein